MESKFTWVEFGYLSIREARLLAEMFLNWFNWLYLSLAHSADDNLIIFFLLKKEKKKIKMLSVEFFPSMLSIKNGRFYLDLSFGNFVAIFCRTFFIPITIFANFSSFFCFWFSFEKRMSWSFPPADRTDFQEEIIKNPVEFVCFKEAVRQSGS